MEAASSIPSSMALALRSVNWQVSPKMEQNALWYCDGIEIEIRWSENRFSPNAESIYIQQTHMPTIEKARVYLRHIIRNDRSILKINLNIQVSTNAVLDALLMEFFDEEKVCLEELYIRRRYVGQHFGALARLIRANAKTLKVIGKIGLGEAIEAFNEEIHLQRLSLISFDLVENGEMDSEELAQKTRFFLRRLGGLGATFEHLSYTTYSGFEITKMPALHMLRMCKVKSLRLTMQSGIAISDPPVIRALLPELRSLELVGNFDVYSDSISRLFPNLEQFVFQKQDLITGLIKRARVLSHMVPDYLVEAHVSPMAAAC
jgi:hypothetical protein